MNIVLRSARIIDSQSPFHQQTVDIFIKDGKISSIGKEVTEPIEHEIQLEGLCVSPGWVDPFAHFCDPGFEYKETLETGAKAAAAGGFTHVFVLPNTAPFLHNKAGIEYVMQRSKSLPISLHAIGAITKNGEGKELAEMYDMHAAGAVAFSDGLQSVQSAGLLLKALQYLTANNTTVIQLPDDQTIHPNGLMHEGVTSTFLGLPGKPAIAEELAIARDIELVKYTGSKIHFTGVSTARSLQLIADAKEEGLAVSCSVTPYHLFFCDEDLNTYDTNLKVSPPLRTKQDRAALQKGVVDGIVDCIATHHLPQNGDDKLVEFEYAKNGMLGLQTAFALVQTVLPQLSDEKLCDLFGGNARKIFDLPTSIIQEGEIADITLFSREVNWTFKQSHNLSRSTNTPFYNFDFTGKPFGIIHKEGLFLGQD